MFQSGLLRSSFLFIYFFFNKSRPDKDVTQLYIKWRHSDFTQTPEAGRLWKLNQVHKCQFTNKLNHRRAGMWEPSHENTNRGSGFTKVKLISMRSAVRNTLIMRPSWHHRVGGDARTEKPPVMWCKPTMSLHIPTHTPTVCVFSVCDVRTFNRKPISWDYSSWDVAETLK